MGCPDTYLTACRQTSDHFVALDLLSRTNAELRLQAISVRLNALALEAIRRVADALAARLGGQVVVFENFPALRKGRVSFVEMASRNLQALLQPRV